MKNNANGGTMPDDEVLQWELKNGIGFHNYEFTLMWHNTFGFLSAAIGDFSSLCDLGAGTGVWPTVCKNMGVNRVVAYDQNPFHRDYHLQHGNNEVEYILEDFTRGIVGRFDIISSIEVFEHIPEKKLSRFVGSLARHCKWFLFSSTPHRAPTDEAWGHINIKSREDWQRYFEANGFQFAFDFPTPTPWTQVYKSLAYD